MTPYAMAKDTLTITDNRTGKSYEVPIKDGCIKTADLRQIKVDAQDFGLMGYDPAFLNTANCRSAITFIDGDKGILEYRGYPIEQLAEKSSYLEVAYLLLNGELPNRKQLDEFVNTVTHHTYVHENIKEYQNRRIQQIRMVAKMPTIAAFSFRHSMGLPYVYPNNDLSFVGNFLAMIKKIGTDTYKVNPVLEHALEVLFILHADHEQNCSTTAVRLVGSSQVDPFSAVAAGVNALYGPLHGGANEAVLRMLRSIGNVSRVPEFIKEVKEGEGETRLMGFGHRVYKSYDPRAKVIKRVADEVFEVTGKNPLLDIALELERIALQDDYFVKRKLYPNVDFYSGLIYQAIGIPTAAFTVLFAIPRTSGWAAQWEEMVLDPEQKIARPRQIYTGAKRRDYVPFDKR